jgi:uncharacterized protein (DUF1800 family)
MDQAPVASPVSSLLALPRDPYSPFVPSESQPWDGRLASHLLRRAALGPSRKAVSAMLGHSPAAAVESLLDFDAADDPFNAQLDQLADFFNFSSAQEVQGWWYHRMLNTPHPAQERIALYWHNHFATSATKVTDAKMMANQIELFRQKGLGNFRGLVKEVTRDPAMLVWLDGRANHKGKPNENYAREVMELFTLGHGNYTEQDIKELARAFTGWHDNNYAGVLDPKQFDDGEKTVFGVTRKLDADGAVDLILSQPAASKHLSEKLIRAFVNPQPMAEQIEHYAARIRELNWEIKPVLKEMLTSRLFYSEWAYRSKIKSPIELVVGAALAFGGRATVDFVRQQSTRLGQNLLYPPNVKGWDGEEAWINANTVLIRFNFGQRIVQTGSDFVAKPDLEAELTHSGFTAPGEIIDFYAGMLLDGRLGAADRQSMIQFMEQGPKTPAGQIHPFALTHDTFNTKVRAVIHMIMSTPEYQLA